jgi:hypothetical protein
MEQSSVLLEKTTVPQLSRTFPPFVESEGSLPCSQEPTEQIIHIRV